MPEKNEKKRKRRFLELLVGKKVIIQSRHGELYEGHFAGVDGDIYILSDAKIVGKKNVAYVDVLGVKNSIIAHIHVEPKKVEPKRG